MEVQSRRRTTAKVGDGLQYQAARRSGSAGPLRSESWAISVTRGKTQVRRGGARYRAVGPLAQGLDTQVGTDLAEGDFQLPAQDKLGDEIHRISSEVGAASGIIALLNVSAALFSWGSGATCPSWSPAHFWLRLAHRLRRGRREVPPLPVLPPSLQLQPLSPRSPLS